MGNVIFSFSIIIESPRSFFYAYYHSYYTALKTYYDFDMTNLGELSTDRSSKEVAAAQITALSYTPTTPFNQRRGCYLDEKWTPSAFPSLDESSEMQSLESDQHKEDPVQVFNKCINSLADAIKKPRIDQLESQVTNWTTSSSAEKSVAIKKADGVCQLMCNVIAPSDGDTLFQAVLCQHKREFGDEGLQALVAAYRSAPSKRLKTQILSIYASRFTAAEPRKRNP